MLEMLENKLYLSLFPFLFYSFRVSTIPRIIISTKFRPTFFRQIYLF